MNVHLESTKDFAKERVEQLVKCLSEIKLLNDDTTAILAGDMNIRDKEVASLSNGTGLPPNIKDVWEFLGKRKEAQYSWDTMRNTNLQLPGKFKPRMRFDRVYIRESQPSRLVPTSFNLIGIEKVPGTQSFPSDHWGILTLFEMDG
jgi:tyrosyl-DNA phosphodiesterase 2